MAAAFANKKRPVQLCTGLFRSGLGVLGGDGVYRTCVNTCSAVYACICVDSTFVTLLADGVNRTGIVTCAAVDALVRNLVSQAVHLPFLRFGSIRMSYQKRHLFSMSRKKSPEETKQLCYLLPSLDGVCPTKNLNCHYSSGIIKSSFILA